MYNKKIFLSLVTITVIFVSALFAQESNTPAANESKGSQQAKELDEFEKSLDSKIAQINKKLEKYSELMQLEVNHTPTQSRFRKGEGYIELEKYDFMHGASNSTEVVGGKKKVIRLYYSGQTFSKIESVITESNYKLKTTKIMKVIDPSPTTEDLGDVEVFRQLNKETPLDFKLSEMQNTISNPNRIQFKKEFYLDFLTNLEEDLRYTRKYVDFYGTNSHKNTIEELKKSVDY
ncbi:MAG: hypothetical protein OEV78_12135 [Spirochaetia bacterium]|nr:hypothetical protein [Spirochaetia bacterium]